MTRQSHLSGIRHEHERSQGIPRTRPAATGPRYGLRALGRSGAATTVDDARLTDASAQVSSVTTNRNQPGPAWYVFVVAFPTADVAALTALIRQAYDSGDAVGMSVAGKLWQAPQPRRKFIALRAEQINMLSRTQAFQLYRLLVPSG